MIDLTAARQTLLLEIGRTVKDRNVLASMAEVPREHFVRPDREHMAYEDIPLPIGDGQTISQPLIVAMMTEALGLKGEETVLEIGTGSGYQAAILSHLARRVVSVERHATLAQRAAQRLQELGVSNVVVHPAEGMLGWPPEAPYDAIIVTAAAPRVPQALLDQLCDGGRIVIPVGLRDQQNLLVVTKLGERIARGSLGGCRFVPLIGDEAWPEDDSQA